jgi:hypothetical protein
LIVAAVSFCSGKSSSVSRQIYLRLSLQVRAVDSFAPAHSASGLPVYVAGLPARSIHPNSESFRELRACPERRRTGQSSLRSRYGGVGSPLPTKPIRPENKSPAGRFRRGFELN